MVYNRRKGFDKKANTIRNNVDDLHKLDIFLQTYIINNTNMSYNVNDMKIKQKKYNFQYTYLKEVCNKLIITI